MHYIGLLILLYLWLIMFPMAILSWFRIDSGTSMARVRYFLFRATEPILRPVRSLIHPIGGIDISFIIVFFGLQIVAYKVFSA
ncbi:MAG TPA: YggT family protein [Acidimicrobiales bacterium]|jgi:YggT family protein